MKIIDHLRSRRYAVAFIFLIIVSLILATAVPQKPDMSKAEQFRFRANYPELHRLASAAGLDHVYTTWWFLGIIFLFSLNIALNLKDRVVVARRQFSDKRFLAGEALERLELSCRLPGREPCAEIREKFAGFFSKRGYAVTEYPDGFVAGRGRAGFWNVPLFHGGLLIVLTGVLVSSLTKFSGSFEISEGQTFRGGRPDFVNVDYGILKLAPKFDFEVRLSKFVAEYWDAGHPRLFQSTVDVARDGRILFSRNIEMNKPLRYEELSFYQTKYYGYSASFYTSDGGAGSGASGFVNFPYKERYSGIQVQHFNIPQTGYKAELKYDMAYPDIVALTVLDGNKTVWKGLLQKEGRVDLGGVYLIFGGIVNWTALTVSRDWGVPVVYSGFALLVLSVFCIVFVTPKTFYVLCDDKGILIGAKTAREREIFREEFEGMISRIKEEVL